MTEPSADSEPSDSVVDSAVRAVLDGVRDGYYVPGQRLIEAALIKRLNISRTALREAFLKLQADGVVQIERHRGATIRQLSRDEVCWTFAVRRELEGLAAALAAPVSAASPAELHRTYASVTNAARQNDMQDFMATNDVFHKYILNASGNPVLVQAAQRLGNTFMLVQLPKAVAQGMMQASLAEHDAIMQALLAGDARAARQATEAHSDASLQRFLALPSHFFAIP